MGPNPPTDHAHNDGDYLMFLSPQDLPLVKDFLITGINQWLDRPGNVGFTQRNNSYLVNFERPDLLITVYISGDYKSQGQSDLQFVTDTLNNLSTHLSSL